MKIQVQPLVDSGTTKLIKSDVSVTAKPATKSLVDSGTTKLIKSDVSVTAKPATKSLLKRMLERQFPNVLLRNDCSLEKVDESQCVTDTEPSSVCLAKMVQNFMEDSEKQTKCGFPRCNCLNGNGSDDSDEDAGDSPFSSSGASEILRSLILSVSVKERNLLADTARIVESMTENSRRNASLKALVAEGLLTLGYDAAVWRSKWEKSSSYPAGEYEYIDVIMPINERRGTDRLIVDVDFKSEFEIARWTSQYRGILQSIPPIFWVWKPNLTTTEIKSY